jgi:hypothetical protein
VLLLATRTALAERDPAECILAHANAQELADSGKLLRARETIQSCATSDCPKLIQKDCNLLAQSIEQATPTLIVNPIDHDGHALTDHRIELDGVALPAPAATEPITLDPGEHRIKLVVAGRQAVEVLIPVRPKEKNQRAVIQMADPDPAASEARVAGYALAGLGALGVASFIGFAVSGYLDQRKLDSRSTHIDNPSDLSLADRMRRKYVIADLSLAIGLVSGGAATYLLYVTRSSRQDGSTGAKTALEVNTAADGASVCLRGVF